MTLAENLRALGVEADDSSLRLAEYAYDASNYRIRPAAVVFPRTAVDVAAVARYCHERSITLTARGGGTGMGGNAIGAGVVLDLSRHMTAVGPVDGERRTVHAEPGVVLTRLRAHVHEQTGDRWTFAPDPSSQNRATVGGAVGNDACGNHSVRYGRTTDHVEELELVTADGLLLTADRHGVRPTVSGDAAAAARARDISSGMRDLATANLAPLRTELERFGRQVSGYHLARLLPENGFDVARALVGSEGTCAIVVGATLSLVPRAANALLVCLGYRDVVDAAADVPLLRTFDPTAVEGVDEAIVTTMRARRGTDSVAALPDGHAWLFVDVDGDSPAEVDAKARDVLAAARAAGRVTGGRVVPDPVERAQLWRVREDGAGLSSRLADPAAPGPAAYESWPGWEDAAVPPDRLAGYLAEFTALLQRHDLQGVMYGHFGAGCMHVRITFDLRSDEGVRVFRAFTNEAARLVVRHGGSLSGEHGDGRARSEYLPLMYSPTMIDAFGRFKRLWDPTGILNPGSIVDAAPVDADLALAGVPDRPWPTVTDLGAPLPGKPAPFVHAVQACIGVGRCRSHSGGVMCPSYRATQDETHSTRGRARVLQEMVRGAATPDEGWGSADVREALDLCLACKACSSDCPVGVDMATYKAEFLHQHYRRRVRPPAHYAFGAMPALLPTARFLAPIANRLARRCGPVARLAGIDPRRTLPTLASRRAVGDALSALPVRADADTLLFVDSFTRAFRPQVATATAAVLTDAGRAVTHTSAGCCGLPLISTGQLGRARKRLRRLAEALDGGYADAAPIVVPEPSCAATIKGDLPRLVDSPAARRVSERVRSFASEVSILLDDGWRPRRAMPGHVLLQQHCHEYSVFGAGLQRSVLGRLGVDGIEVAEGCCGVAGDFGFEAGHYETSMAIAEHALAPALRARPHESVVLTDGFSCHMAVDHLTTIGQVPAATPMHLAELLADRPLRR
ncbi:FAD-binding and (Fe-S)-binding domain-containing protein [Tsukamurella sp. 8F]|uniref:FAD-binding and (Fe-S)-binding domain-containing protein n=1 Tax=unclassified Tsukamurella TaxID=2633480 RepID=UPI0023B8EE14|nr:MULTISPECIES: FAD-binding and (Fe-S)-binding domain-containing protein [unclassified Tsukamurella]MDF0531202.1 FAD-binding and (Fe-S)-binding domain-containing protein [Tsukamurella sp. 8J]MDF0588471.1 FAD-binding and (Fe-S)-binding domain-containing protein [Tsukamurella sp. 8F]